MKLTKITNGLVFQPLSEIYQLSTHVRLPNTEKNPNNYYEYYNCSGGSRPRNCCTVDDEPVAKFIMLIFDYYDNKQKVIFFNRFYKKYLRKFTEERNKKLTDLIFYLHALDYSLGVNGIALDEWLPNYKFIIAVNKICNSKCILSSSNDLISILEDWESV